MTAPATRAAARISFNRRLMSEYSRVLVDQLLHVLLEANHDLLADIDVQVDLDRLVGRAHLNASRSRQDRQCGEKELQPSHRILRRIGAQSRQYRYGHGTVSLSWG